MHNPENFTELGCTSRIFEVHSHFPTNSERLAANNENNQQTSEEILLSTIDGLPDDKLTGFALRLVVTAHIPIPHEGELDLLTEAKLRLLRFNPRRQPARKQRQPHRSRLLRRPRRRR
jgi:ParB family chromosome partitioning protein